MSTPILKWAGGKRKLSERIVSLAPPEFHTYHEPFFGGGAVFFGLCREGRISRSVLNDLNTDLIDTYRAIRDDVNSVADELGLLAEEYLAAAHEDRPAIYYRVRGEKPPSGSARAAWLIFLNRTCFNGLYRVNRSGGFNVPHGDYVNPRILDKEALRAASACFLKAEFNSEDFELTCRGARAGDFVYLDPPYQPLTATANFTSYTSSDFSEADQIRLRDKFEDLTRRGVAAVLSNSSHPLVMELYEGRGFTLEEVLMARAINSVGDGRAPIPELLISNLSRAEVGHAFSSSPK